MRRRLSKLLRQHRAVEGRTEKSVHLLDCAPKPPSELCLAGVIAIALINASIFIATMLCLRDSENLAQILAGQGTIFTGLSVLALALAKAHFNRIQQYHDALAQAERDSTMLALLAHIGHSRAELPNRNPD